MNSLQILSFVGFTLLVAVITWWKVRKTDTGSQQGYFLAGRSLKAPVIAASLMLTNLSTEQLVGLSGQAYKSGMSVMGWEVTSAVTLIFLALIFLPRYLKRGIATIPDFLEERYDKTTRIIIDFCFLIATGVCFLPIVLYSGALALNSLFHVGGIATDFSRCGYLATGNFAWSGGNFVCGDRRTARNGSGGLHQRYWAGYRRVDGAGIWPNRDGQGQLYAGH